jgi:RNA polymerase sigma factor (sigma-70 family)
MTDSQLLSEYVATRNPEAFSRLVHRHIDLVYAAALRQTRDRHLADDVTQAVFLILFRKAGTIRNPAMLCCWLIRTAQFAAKQACRAESRRRLHEQKAASMILAEKTSHFDDAQITALLDLGLSRLGSADRGAIILRYLRGQSLNDVGVELGLSANSAHKRITRALGKLRAFFHRNGITVPQDVLESALAAQCACAAPPMLASTVFTHALGDGGTSTGGAVIARTTLKAMSVGKAMLVIGSASAAALVLGVGTLIAILKPVSAATSVPASPASSTQNDAAVSPSVSVPSAAPLAVTPSSVVTLPNITFAVVAGMEQRNKDSYVALDPTVPRNGQPTLLLSSTSPKWGVGNNAARPLNFEPFLGKRMRFWAYVKSENLANWGGIQVWALGANSKFMLGDDMGGRPIIKTTDWQKYEIVADVPADIQQIIVGLHLYGAGKIWMDGAQAEVVGPEVPVTDDSAWHAWSFSSPHYAHTLDGSTLHDGHPTICLNSTVARSGEWYAWDWNDRYPDQYRGKRVRMSAWIKTQNVYDPSGLNFRIMGDHLDAIAPTVTKFIRGTNDWKKYELIASIPEETGCICSGFRLNGRGKLWLDDVKYEIVDDLPATK